MQANKKTLVAAVAFCLQPVSVYTHATLPYLTKQIEPRARLIRTAPDRV